jgi:hypothetical protein
MPPEPAASPAPEASPAPRPEVPPESARTNDALRQETARLRQKVEALTQLVVNLKRERRR